MKHVYPVGHQVVLYQAGRSRSYKIMRTSRLLLAIVWLAGSPAAQRKLVIPRGFGLNPGNWHSDFLLDRTKPALPRSIQAVFRIHTGDAGRVMALSFRPKSNVAWGTRKFSVVLTLGFSTYTKRIVDVDPVLSRNRGRDHTIVFQGAIAFPAVPRKMRAISPFIFRIPLQKQFAIHPNTTILWDLRVSSSSQRSNGTNGGAMIDLNIGWPQARPPYVPVTYFGRACKGNYLLASGMAVGHRFAMYKGRVSGATLTNSLGILTLGASRTRWGPVRLPFSLGLGAPGCSVYVSPDVLLPAFYRQSGGGVMASSVVPRQTTLVGKRIYGQGFLLNAKNKLGIQTSAGVEWRIGPWFPLDYAYVWSDHDMNPFGVGLPYCSSIPIFQLEIQ